MKSHMLVCSSHCRGIFGISGWPRQLCKALGLLTDVESPHPKYPKLVLSLQCCLLRLVHKLISAKLKLCRAQPQPSFVQDGSLWAPLHHFCLHLKLQKARNAHRRQVTLCRHVGMDSHGSNRQTQSELVFQSNPALLKVSRQQEQWDYL